MTRWLDDLATLQQSGEGCVAVTVTSTRGSVPREAGTKMLVTDSQVFGTIGGGNLEYKAIEIARGLLGDKRLATTRRFPLGASLGQCCGGLVNLLFEPVDSAAGWVGAAAAALAGDGHCAIVTATTGDGRRGKLVVTQNGWAGCTGHAANDLAVVQMAHKRLVLGGEPGIEVIDGTNYFVELLKQHDFDIVLFGAGHVGRALVKILADLDCHIKWVDSREHEFPAEIPVNVERIAEEYPQVEVTHANPGSYFLVMTHSHQLDQVLSETILRRGDFAYFGLIGSLTKRRLFEKRMLDRGIEQERFASMTCPIGSGGPGSKVPMAIAVAVAAELIGHHSRIRAQGATGRKSLLETQALVGSPDHFCSGRCTCA